jgi:hypothetical protein
VSGNIIWAEDIKEHATTTESGGGKGGPTYSNTTYTYTQSFAVAISGNELSFVSRIWADGNLIYDTTTGSVTSNGNISFDFYPGTNSQAPNSRITADIESKYGVSTGGVAFRGLAYVVFYDLGLTDYGNRIPNLSFEVTSGDAAVPASMVASDIADAPEQMSRGWFFHAMDGPNVFFVYEESYNSYTFLKINAATNKMIKSRNWGEDNALPDGTFFDPRPGQMPVCVLADGDIATVFDWNILVKLDKDTLEKKNTKTQNITLSHTWVNCVACTHVRMAHRSKNLLFVSFAGSNAIDVRFQDDYTKPAYVLIGGTSGIIEVPVNDAYPVSMCTDPDNNLWILSVLDEDSAGGAYENGKGYLTKVETDTLDATSYAIPENIYISPYTSKCIYDAINDSIWFTGWDETDESNSNFETDVTWVFFRFDPSSSSIAARTPAGTYFDNYSLVAEAGFITGDFFTYNPLDYLLYKISSTTAEVLKVWDVESVESLGVYVDDAGIYIPQMHSFVAKKWPRGMANVFLDRNSSIASTTAAHIADSLCSAAGIDSSRRDFSCLENCEVLGFVRDSVSSARTFLSWLQQMRLFDVVESGGVLRAVKRGSVPAIEISHADLRATEGETLPDDSDGAISVRRTQDTDLPREVDVTYISAGDDYDQAIQRSIRQNCNSRAVSTIDMHVVMDETSAAEIAAVVHRDLWTSRDSVSFTVSRSKLYLEPSDVVRITYEEGGVTRDVRLTSVTLGMSGVISCEGVTCDDSVYAVEIDGSAKWAGETSISYPSPSEIVVMDIPITTADTGSTPYVWVAAAGTMDKWSGSYIYGSTDGELWEFLYSHPTAAVIGKTATALSDSALADTWDEISTIVITGISYNFALSSASSSQVLAGWNEALVGDEIIRFRDATEVDGGVQISGLRRGLKGTEWAISNHGNIEPFVLLTSGSSVHPGIHHLEMSSSYIGESGMFRATTFNDAYNTPATVSIEYKARALMPYAPTQISALRTGSGSLELEWTRRTRVLGDWSASIPPLGETTEAYDVDVVVGGDVVRTISTTTAAATYTAAQYNADTSSSESAVPEVTVRIYQISEVVGRGYPAEEVV